MDLTLIYNLLRLWFICWFLFNSISIILELTKKIGFNLRNSVGKR